MSTSRILLILFILIAITLPAQVKKNRYRIKVIFVNDAILKGDLISLNDSSIHMVKYRPMADTVLMINDIMKISVLRKGAPTTGFLAGLGIGAGLGAAIGYVSYSPPSCDGGFCLDFGPEFSALGGALLGGVAGGLIGMAARSVYTEYPIYGNRNAYHNFRHQLSEESTSRYQKKLAKKRVPINDEVD